MQIPHLNINVSTTSIHTALEKYLSFPFSWEQTSALLATSSAAKDAFPALCRPMATFTQTLVLFVLEHIPRPAQSTADYYSVLLRPALRRLADCSVLDDKLPLPALALIFILGVFLLVASSFTVKRLSRRKCSPIVVPIMITPTNGDRLDHDSHQKHAGPRSRSIGTQTELDDLCSARPTEKDTDGRPTRRNLFSFITPPTTPDQCTSRPVLLGVTTPKKVTFANLDQPATFARSLPDVDTPTPLAGNGGTSLSRLPIRAALKVKNISASDGKGLSINDMDVQPLEDVSRILDLTQLASPPQAFSIDLDSPSPLSPRQRKRQRQMARNKAKTGKATALAA